MLDAYDSVEENTNNVMSVYECLVDVANKLAIKPVMPPFLVPYYCSSTTQDNGISAFMLFDGGHITVHTFPYRRCYFADVLSEEHYSGDDACKAFLSFFNADIFKTEIFDRNSLDQRINAKPNLMSDFGPHYMITVYDVDMSMESIFRWLDELAPRINVKAIARPYVINSTINNSKYISGILVIAKSHVAVHYNVIERRAYIDVFSCVFLDKNQIDTVLNESFAEHYSYKLFVRGEKFHTY